MKEDTLHLTTGSGKHARNVRDHYDTPIEVTIALMDFLQLEPCRVWEPACGANAMANVISSYGHKVIGTDIAKGEDYLTSARKVDAIITNPPFFLAGEFIEKATSEAPVVAMLLKSQFWHARKRLTLFESNPPSWILPLTWRPDFLYGERGGSPTMEVLWTVWIKGNHESRCVPLAKPQIKEVER